MIKGDKIRLVKPMGVFTNIGEICEVTNVADGGVISFKFGGVHLGCMSYDEYEKYFESVEFPIKSEWSGWEDKTICFYDLDGNKDRLDIKFRENGKKVQVRCANLMSESTCHRADEFDFNKGFELATKRLLIKYFDSQVKNLAKDM